MSNPGPQNIGLVRSNPCSKGPPPTDQGSVGDLAFLRYDPSASSGGGWSHQVTQREIPLSTDIAGVNLRIDSGAFREVHWQTAGEWAYMLTGSTRVTLFGTDGSMFIDDIQAGDLWNFPAGLPHSIQGLGKEGCEFLLVFNDGSFSAESTFLLSDWLKHTPPELLQKNFRSSRS